jgi:hypothetical protein
VKLIPLLGSLVSFGVIIQIILGMQVTAGSDNLLGAHIVIGILGFVLVLALTAAAFRMRSATAYSRILMIILLLAVLAQMALGFQILNGSDVLVVSHEGNGFLILILSFLMGGLTMMAARRKG